MTELQNATPISAELNSPEEKHDYYFTLESGSAAIVTFSGSLQEYKVTTLAVPLSLDKGKPVNAHNVTSPSFTDGQPCRFEANSAQTIYITVASANSSQLPADGYTIVMEQEVADLM